jgi:hypothetical protein
MTQKQWQVLLVTIKQRLYLAQHYKLLQNLRTHKLFLFYQIFNQLSNMRMTKGNRIEVEEYFNKIPNNLEDNLKIKYNKQEKVISIFIAMAIYLQMMKSLLFNRMARISHSILKDPFKSVINELLLHIIVTVQIHVEYHKLKRKMER